VRLTVAICTWNRAALLRRALASHAAALVPAGVDREVVVVDNGSTDETPAVIREFAGRLPLRHVTEREPGLSHARNAAVRAAQGDYVLWTDDDVLIRPEWIAAYVDAATRWPDAAVLGGPILPRFDAPPPEWLRRALPVVGNAFALLDLGSEPIRFGGDVLPFGANFAVRLREQRRHPYSPQWGRVRESLACGEETAVVSAILAAGGTGWYVPTARVEHLIPPGRQSVGYLRDYYRANAASVRASLAPGVPTILGRPRWVWRMAVEHQVRYWLTRGLASPERWALHLRRASEGRGLLRARWIAAPPS
jgi:glycosyltransferase involved in cell wall biosynthesis